MRAPVKGPAICTEKPCGKAANPTMTIAGRPYCTRHGNKIITHQQQAKEELKRYYEYQTKAFGDVVAPWAPHDLTQRLDELNQTDRSGDDLRTMRLIAEHLAISREIERRRTT